MKTLTLIILTVLLATSAKSQTWYQKDKTYHPFVAGSAAAGGGVDLFKSLKNFVGKDIWTGVGGGIMNKNTSIGAEITSYEYTDMKESYIGAIAQRRLFAIGRLEPWILVAYHMSLTGEFQSRLQPAFLLKIHLHKAVILEGGIQKLIYAYDNWSFNKRQAVMLGFTIPLRGNVHSNNK